MIRHFTSHLSEILEHHEGYRGRRLVTFLAGAEGYAHGIHLVLPSGTKILSHWHEDREAIFYCMRGHGYYFLDGEAREVFAGDVMFIPLMAVHGVAGGDADLEILDFALFSDTRSTAAAEDCFAHALDRGVETTPFGVRRTFFPPEIYGNPAIKWVGVYELRTGEALGIRDVPIGTEQLIIVQEGYGTLQYLGSRLELRPGSIAYLIAGVDFVIRPLSGQNLVLVGTSSVPGRYPEPQLFKTLKKTYAFKGDTA